MKRNTITISNNYIYKWTPWCHYSSCYHLLRTAHHNIYPQWDKDNSEPTLCRLIIQFSTYRHSLPDASASDNFWINWHSLMPLHQITFEKIDAQGENAHYEFFSFQLTEVINFFRVLLRDFICFTYCFTSHMLQICLMRVKFLKYGLKDSSFSG